MGVVVVLGGVYFVQSKYFNNTTKYETREMCEEATGEHCQKSFGDYVLPNDSEARKEALECLSKVPKGWAPRAAFPDCSWSI